jgi:hypothetical protein
VVAYSAVRDAALAAARRTGRRDTCCGPSGLGSCTRGDDCTHGDAAASSTASGVSSAPESPPVDQGSGEGEFRSMNSWAAAAAEAALSSADRRLASAVPRFFRTSFTPHALHSVLGPAGGGAGDASVVLQRVGLPGMLLAWPAHREGRTWRLAREVRTAGTLPPLWRAGGAALRARFGPAVGTRQAGRRDLPGLYRQTTMIQVSTSSVRAYDAEVVTVDRFPKHRSLNLDVQQADVRSAGTQRTLCLMGVAVPVVTRGAVLLKSSWRGAALCRSGRDIVEVMIPGTSACWTTADACTAKTVHIGLEVITPGLVKHGQ